MNGLSVFRARGVRFWHVDLHTTLHDYGIFCHSSSLALSLRGKRCGIEGLIRCTNVSVLRINPYAAVYLSCRYGFFIALIISR